MCKSSEIESPNGKFKWENYVLGSVDDARQYLNDWKSNNRRHIIKKLKHTSHTWEHLLFASGGKLEIHKYAFYVLEWTFTKQGIIYIITHPNLQPFQLQSSEDKQL